MLGQPKLGLFPTWARVPIWSGTDVYEKFLHSVGIAFEWTVDRNSKSCPIETSLVQKKLLVFQKISIKELLPRFTDSNKIENLWKSFIDLFGELKLDYSTDNETEAFRQNVKKWTEEFIFFYQASDVTPYMHTFRVHVPEFLELYKNISLFISKALRNI